MLPANSSPGYCFNCTYNGLQRNLTDNDTTSSPVISYNPALARVEISIQAMVLFLALFGNIGVIVVLFLRGKKLSRMQWFIVHLSLADIFVALFNVMPQMIWDITVVFHGNNFLCKFVRFVNVQAMYASTYVLLMTAVDRYLSICHPLTSYTWMTPTRIHIMVICAWVMSVVFSIPQLFIFSFSNSNCLDNFDADWQIKLYVVWIAVSVYFGPFVILTIAYSCICVTVWRSTTGRESGTLSCSHSSPRNGAISLHNREMDGCGAGNSPRLPLKITYRSDKSKNTFNHTLSTEDQTSQHLHNPSRKTLQVSLTSSLPRHPRGSGKALSKSKIKTIKLTLTVTICFLLCWAPFFICQLWWAFDSQAPISNSWFVISIMLASLNSCTNPWIYLAFSGNLCTNVRQQLRRRVNATESDGKTGFVEVPRPVSPVNGQMRYDL